MGIMKRNGEIDFLRFLFSVIIALFHFGDTLRFAVAPFGSIGVEFFFILTGYFMAKHVEAVHRKAGDQSISISDETWRYIIRKIGQFYRYYFVAIILQMILRYIIVGRGIVSIMSNFLKSIPTLTITFVALNSNDVGFYVGNTWYLSAMIIAIFFLYPILLKNYDLSVKLIFPAVSILIIGYIHGNYAMLSVWNQWTGVMYVGILRSVSEIALGCCICPLAEFLSKRIGDLSGKEKIHKKAGLTIIKCVGYAVPLCYAINCIPELGLNAEFGLHAMCFCFIGITLSLSGVGWCIPDCALTRTLGRLSLPIFIFHGVIRHTIADYHIDSVSPFMFWTIIVFAMAACILLMCFTDFLFDRLRRLEHGKKVS